MSDWHPFDDKPIVDPGAIAWSDAPGWRPDNVGRCRTCAAPIRWCVHVISGRKSPFDPSGVNHFATCPNAQWWRERKPKKEAP